MLYIRQLIVQPVFFLPKSFQDQQGDGIAEDLFLSGQVLYQSCSTRKHSQGLGLSQDLLESI